MKQSQYRIKTLKETPKDADNISTALLSRAGFIDKLAAGIYSFLPLGYRVLKKIEDIIRQEMDAIGGQEILMPALHPRENWEKTGRWGSLDVIFRVKSRANQDYALGSTHEEIVAPLAKGFINSYRDLPLYLYQIQTKFRDEPRAKSGLLRTREFSMKDLYSFHADQEDLDRFYEKAQKAYDKIYQRVGIGRETFKTYAGGGSFSKYSHEYQTLTEAGEDEIYFCEDCQVAINREIIDDEKKCPECGRAKDDLAVYKAIEVGNIFKLGTKFSAPFELNYLDKNGQSQQVIMGCYGIGPSRVLGAVVEVHHDERGIIWPEEIAPFKVHLILLSREAKVKKIADDLYDDLTEKRVEVLYDDTDDTAGVKFANSDLIGIPYRIVFTD